METSSSTSSTTARRWKRLIRYGFDGYGTPEDDNGIVVFAEDRLALTQVVGHISSADYSMWDDADFRQLRDCEDVTRHFEKHGLQRAKELAKRVAAASNAFD